MNDDYAVLSRVTPRVGIPCRTPDGLTPLVYAEDPAISVMTDFSEVTPVTIEPGLSIDLALRKMKEAGVRLLLMTDREDNITGIITSYDIQGDWPLRLVQEQGIAHADIRVQMLMTPLDEVMAMDIITVRGARVGHIINTLRDNESKYTLVIETDRGSGEQVIRGLFSIAYISKLMGYDAMDAEFAAHSLAEVQHQLG
ncbi:MAG: CBS domain-containing protein [Gammaproteobacteria bacterium]